MKKLTKLQKIIINNLVQAEIQVTEWKIQKGNIIDDDLTIEDYEDYLKELKEIQWL